MIGNMHDGEKLDRFIVGLKYHVRVELMKTICNTFEESARIALNIYSAIWISKRTTNDYYQHKSDSSGPMPI